MGHLSWYFYHHCIFKQAWARGAGKNNKGRVRAGKWDVQRAGSSLLLLHHCNRMKPNCAITIMGSCLGFCGGPTPKIERG